MTSIYLDHAAATPMRPSVREAMDPHLHQLWGNPSSVHRWGREARRALEEARERIARLLQVPPAQVHFTRGGTEALNLAVMGRVAAAREGSAIPLFLSTGMEHSAVRRTLEAAEREGVQVELLPVAPDGSVDEEALDRALARRPALVSLQWVNSEVGLLLPILEVALQCTKAGVPLLVDGVQAAGHFPLSLKELPISLLALAGHKVGGPRSGGVLVVRDGVALSPRLFGGGQEKGLRPGTEDVASAVGMAVALEEAQRQLPTEAPRLAELRDTLTTTLRAAFPGARVHGEEGSRAPHVVSLGFPGLPRDLLLGALDLAGVGASAGSACRSGGLEVSPTLEVLYGSEYAASVAPLRLSLGWTTTPHEVMEGARIVWETVERLGKAGV